MKAVRVSFTLCLLGVSLSACNSTSNSISRAGLAADAKDRLVGRTKGEILACMGVPARAISADGVDVLSYNSGGGDMRTFSNATLAASPGLIQGFGTSRSVARSCEVDMVFEGGRVSRVNYKGRTGGLLTQGEQCAFVVQNCM